MIIRYDDVRLQEQVTVTNASPLLSSLLDAGVIPNGIQGAFLTSNEASDGENIYLGFGAAEDLSTSQYMKVIEPGGYIDLSLGESGLRKLRVYAASNSLLNVVFFA